MLPALRHRALYAAFDRFPSRKGSAVHIDRFARALFEQAGGGLLYVLGGDGLPPYQREDDVEIVRYEGPPGHLLERVAGFGARLSALLDRVAPALELVHFRDPWSGIPIVEHAQRRSYVAVYEVNGLPSIELPFRYPGMAPAILEHVAELEHRCLVGADVVITPSAVTAGRLRARGVDPGRLHVIRNGADVPERPAPAPASAPARYLLYFGALQPWQGVDTALRALARLSDLDDLELVVCASEHRRRAKPYRKLAEHLGVADRMRWEFALPEHELAPWRDHALLSLAPLRDCSRNAVQGCAPLKIIESMAAGVPVVASDLPAVRELIVDGEHGRLVAPDRPAELARAIRVLLDYPERRAEMGARARARVAAQLSWSASVAQLRAVYGAVGRAAPPAP
ncbi:MAG TPA: glycosyltransferase family 4 protein [Solirubrobacteraceae bacterium]|nr:glycosyltransferase family 4 protein [Solirubrobacteraceae bacterium]